MVGPLLDSKCRVPSRRPGAVVRPRLTERISGVTSKALTLLSAPAGFGKTTLLTEWLATLPAGGPAIAWLSLDERDNDPALFWTYVVSALRVALDQVGAGALTLLEPSASTEVDLAALLNDLDGLSDDLVLVLDDYHLIEAPDVHQGMALLVEHQPPRLHLVLATRADPALALSRLRARGDLLELRAADLRFTADESAAYLNGPMGLALTSPEVAALDGRTEGWIAALQLAALSMQGRDDVSAFISGFAGDDRYIVDYLVEEVLARQPVEVRDFLLKTSLLERLSGPLCDAVTGRSNGKATLVALERANLFLVPLDDRRRWFRYHHLFADVLQAHLLDEHADEVLDLHLRASSWFEGNGETSPAIDHALAGADHPRAAQLMELAMPMMQRERREAELRRWVGSLPEEVVRRRPVLGIAFVGALAQAGEFDTVAARLSDIEGSLCPDGGSWPEQPPEGLVVVDEVAFRSLPAGIDLYRAALALTRGDLDGTVTHARRAMSLTPPNDDLIRAAAGALAGLASWTIGDLAVAHDAYTESVAGLRRAGFTADVLGCCVTLGDICRTQGRLDDAMRTYTGALELAQPKQGTAPLRGTADMHVGMAELLVDRDDLPAAASHLASSEQLGEHNGLPQNPYRRRLVMARLRAAAGDLDGALALVDEADRVYNGDYSPNVRPVPAVRARLQVRRGELGPAGAWARERQLSAADEPTYLREFEHIALARLLLARHHAERDDAVLHEATGLLERLLAAAEEGGRAGSALEVLVLLALAGQARGDLQSALSALQQAVTLAEPHGFVRLFADEGQPMAALLKVLTKQGSASPYLRRLLAATSRTGEPAPAAGHLVEPLSERELDVLRMLGSDLDGPDIARELRVSLNTLRSHTRNIYAKLGVTSRRGAVRQGRELDLIAGPHHS